MNENNTNGKEKRCLDCKWCAVDPNSAKQGVCKRYPPSVVIMGVSPQGPRMASMYPVVRLLQDVCGEFELETISLTKNLSILTYKTIQ